jgi:hypothetical protein
MGERRNFGRVHLGRGYSASIMAIDGTWQRACRIGDVSESGARLIVKGSLNGLDINEFFLALSTTGKAHRRCVRVWLKGDEIGVRFMRDQTMSPRRRRVSADGHDAEPRNADHNR